MSGFGSIVLFLMFFCKGLVDFWVWLVWWYLGIGVVDLMVGGFEKNGEIVEVVKCLGFCYD